MRPIFIATTVGGALVTAYKSLINADGTVNEESLKKGLTTSLISTGTAAVSNTIVEVRSDRILNKYAESHASAYVESMSDEELVAALEKLDLLEAAIEVNEDVKSL